MIASLDTLSRFIRIHGSVISHRKPDLLHTRWRCSSWSRTALHAKEQQEQAQRQEPKRGVAYSKIIHIMQHIRCLRPPSTLPEAIDPLASPLPPVDHPSLTPGTMTLDCHIDSGDSRSDLDEVHRHLEACTSTSNRTRSRPTSFESRLFPK
jgi:hypothetical protein